MAVITLSVPDDLMERIIKEHNSTNPNKGIVDLLRRFIDYPPTKRALLFSYEQRREIEALFGEPIDATNVDRFIAWVRTRASVNVGGVEIPLTAGQLKRAQSNATFWRSTDGQPHENLTRDYIHAQVRESLASALGV